MNEAFLKHIWQFKLWNKTKTLVLHETNDEIQILSPGISNNDEGPDFFNAKIKIGNTTWAGNVEIHIKSSDWFLHQHQHHKAYENIILHVVYENDKELIDKNGELVNTLELKNYINNDLIEKYSNLLSSSIEIPCSSLIKTVNEFTISNFIEKLSVERLEEKTKFIRNSLELNKNNWEETFYHSLGRNFGFHINSVPFELLVKSIPLKIFGQIKNNIKYIESLLFGQAGLLENIENEDDYINELKAIYKFLKQKFSLQPIQTHLWKFLRTRPSNFPTIRIAQFAMLIYKSEHLFSKIIENENFENLTHYFKVDTTEYWKTHYMLGEHSTEHKTHLGENSIHNIIINTVVPILFSYGIVKNDEKYKDVAIELLQKCFPDINKYNETYEDIGITIKNAMYSQALLHLKKNYCIQKKCLHCAIGNDILKHSAHEV